MTNLEDWSSEEISSFFEVTDEDDDFFRNFETTSVESDGSTHGTNDSDLNKKEEKRIVRMEKSRCWFKISLLLSILVIIILSLTVVILGALLIHTHQQQISETSTDLTTSYTYPMFHTTTKEGERSFQGMVTQPDPLDHPLVFFSKEGDNQVMFLIDDEDPFNRGVDPDGKRLFQIELDLYCCPEESNVEGRRIKDYTICTLLVHGSTLNVLSEGYHTLSEDIDERLKLFGSEFCPAADQVVDCDVYSKKETSPEYVCLGLCSPVPFSDFLQLNPSYVEDAAGLREEYAKYADDSLLLDALEYKYKEESDRCTRSKLEQQKMDLSDDEIGGVVQMVGYDVIDERFKNEILQPFCSKFEAVLRSQNDEMNKMVSSSRRGWWGSKNDDGEVEVLSKMYGNMCRAGEHVCVVNVIVTLGELIIDGVSYVID